MELHCHIYAHVILRGSDPCTEVFHWILSVSEMCYPDRPIAGIYRMYLLHLECWRMFQWSHRWHKKGALVGNHDTYIQPESDSILRNTLTHIQPVYMIGTISGG